MRKIKALIQAQPLAICSIFYPEATPPEMIMCPIACFALVEEPDEEEEDGIRQTIEPVVIMEGGIELLDVMSSGRQYKIILNQGES